MYNTEREFAKNQADETRKDVLRAATDIDHRRHAFGFPQTLLHRRHRRLALPPRAVQNLPFCTAFQNPGLLRVRLESDPFSVVHHMPATRCQRGTRNQPLSGIFNNPRSHMFDPVFSAG